MLILLVWIEATINIYEGKQLQLSFQAIFLYTKQGRCQGFMNISNAVYFHILKKWKIFKSEMK